MSKEALNKLAEILSSDFAFESDGVRLDIINGRPVTDRERQLAEIVSQCYKIVHPLTSECCKPKEAEKVKEHKCDKRRLGPICVCCPCGCDIEIDDPHYSCFHGQKCDEHAKELPIPKGELPEDSWEKELVSIIRDELYFLTQDGYGIEWAESTKTDIIDRLKPFIRQTLQAEKDRMETIRRNELAFVGHLKTRCPGCGKEGNQTYMEAYESNSLFGQCFECVSKTGNMPG